MSLETDEESTSIEARTYPPWIENKRSRHWRIPRLGELWQYRELVWFLALRDVKVRYKQAGLGVAWAVVQPLVAAALFTFVFNRLGRIEGDGVPYPVFAYSGLVAWSYFSSTVADATHSLVGNRDLVTKVYVPRIVAPVASVLPALVDLGVSLVALAGLAALYGVLPGWGIVALPVSVLLVVLVAFSVGLWLSALNVMYRDTSHVITFGMQVWLLASPVAYPLSIVHGGFRWLYVVNPMVGAISVFRWAAVGGPPPGAELLVCLLTTVLLLAGGILFFQAAERRFADVI